MVTTVLYEVVTLTTLMYGTPNEVFKINRAAQ